MQPRLQLGQAPPDFTGSLAAFPEAWASCGCVTAYAAEAASD
jgi:hypothetical protein